MEGTKAKKGISLITLVITIIIMIILATAVILTLTNTNIITEGRRASTLREARELQDALVLHIAEQMMAGNPTDVSGCISVILGIPGYDNEYAIQSGRIVYIGTNTEREQWVAGIDIQKAYMDHCASEMASFVVNAPILRSRTYCDIFP